MMGDRSKSHDKGRVIFETKTKPPMSITQHCSSYVGKKAHFQIQPYEIDNELIEPKVNELNSNDLAVNVILEPVKPDYKLIKKQKNPFHSSEYWLSKGYKMQTGRSSNENLNKHLDQKN